MTHWLHQHSDRALYWVAEPTSALDQLRSFSQALYNFTTPDAPAPLDFTYANWEQAFRQVALMATHEKFALFIDELGYLVEVNPPLTGVLQKAWDHWLGQSQLLLALSGSQMGIMQQMTTYEAPLYGRATAQLNLPPLPFSATREYFPNYSARERVAIYAIWGGVPAYWERIDPTISVLDNVSEQLLPSNTLMQEEPRLLLQDFINEPSNYVGILRAIAGGSHTNARIATRTGLPKTHISRYLGTLRDTGFVTRQVPVTEEPSKSRRGRYYITDPYLRFHYRFLAAYQAKLALGEQQQMRNYIESMLPIFIEANTWTELAREWLLRASVHNLVPLNLEQVGGAWVRSDNVDVVGIHAEERNLVLGVCHWQDHLANLGGLESVIHRTASIMPEEDRHKWRVYYVGFAAPGWTLEARERVETMVKRATRGTPWETVGVKLVDLTQVDEDLLRWGVNGSES